MFIHEHQSEFSRFSDYLFNDTPRTIAAFLVNTYIRSSTLLIFPPSLAYVGIMLKLLFCTT